jgi:hypothetical protein
VANMTDTKLVDLCPHCRQPVMQDAKTSNLKGGATIECEFCDEQASFIIHRHAVCFAHRSIPLTRQAEVRR